MATGPCLECIHNSLWNRNVDFKEVGVNAKGRAIDSPIGDKAGEESCEINVSQPGEINKLANQVQQTYMQTLKHS